MNMHVSVCITSRSDGKIRQNGRLLRVSCALFLHTISPGFYEDIVNGIEGAFSPVIIYANGSSKDKEKNICLQEQTTGVSPKLAKIPPKYKAGLRSPGIKVYTTRTGSMTREIFYFYAEHFIESLPANHKPIILLLDGHSSRWSVSALRYFMKHNVFPFFLPSHTSIWSQTNDNGVNIRFHLAIEQYSRKFRRSKKKQKSTINKKFQSIDNP